MKIAIARSLKYVLAVAIFSTAFTSLGRKATENWATKSGKDKTDILAGDTHLKKTAASEMQILKRQPDTSQAKEIQLALHRCGFLPQKEIDGFLGATTINAIKSFQSSVDIGVDGIYGPITSSLGEKCN